MRRNRLIRRIVSVALAVAMVMPAVSVAVEAATMTWLAPQPGERLTTRFVEVSVGYNTQSDLRVTRLQLWVDGKYHTGKALVRPESRGVASFAWDTSKFSRGLHDLVVKIYAGDELISSVSCSSTIGQAGYDLRAPVVRFANVKTGDVLKGTPIIRMKVTDDGGQQPIVSLLVDSVLKYLTNREPYAYPLDTAKYTDGDHELQTFAYDGSGNKSDPAVVKVAFRNGQERPVVAALSLDPRPEPVARSEDDGVGTMVPPVASEPASRDARSASAARAADPAIRTGVSTTEAHPVARPAVPKIAPVAARQIAPSRAVSKPVQFTPAPSSVTAAPSVKATPRSMAPQKMAFAVEPASPVVRAQPREIIPPVASEPSLTRADAYAGIRSTKAQMPRVRQSPAASAPRGMAPAQESRVRVASTPAMPTSKPARISAAPVGRAAVAPRAAVTPRESRAPAAESAAAPVVRPAGEVRVARSIESPMVPKAAMADAVTSDVPVAVRPSTGAGIRGAAADSRLAAGRPQAPRSAVSNERPAPSKTTKVAMLPTVRNQAETVAAPLPARKDTRAKLEKRTLPAKGKLKLRDLFEGLGGVVFWDSETHTVIAYAQNMKLELTIGSSVVKVNGKELRVKTVPKIAAGRTIIDAGLYHQVRALADSMGKSASAGRD